jgi:hypothetical protein
VCCCINVCPIIKVKTTISMIGLCRESVKHVGGGLWEIEERGGLRIRKL